MGQVKSQATPSQVATPLGGATQGAHEAPQALASLARQRLSGQVRVPVGQLPLHDTLWSMQAPAHSFSPVGQPGTQAVPLQLTNPPIGASQGAQRSPQVARAPLGTQADPHRW